LTYRTNDCHVSRLEVTDKDIGSRDSLVKMMELSPPPRWLGFICHWDYCWHHEGCLAQITSKF